MLRTHCVQLFYNLSNPGMEDLPYAPDAWYDPDSVKVGYEISFTRHSYKPQPLRPLEEIRADILALERETEGLLAEIVGDWGVEEYAV